MVFRAKFLVSFAILLVVFVTGCGNIILPFTPAPVINSFSVNGDIQFSLSAQHYSVITFQAECGSFVDVLRSPDGASVSFPTGSASICNAPQYFLKSTADESSDTPPLVNVYLNLFNAQGIVDGSTTFIGNPPGMNIDGSATLTVTICNSAGECVHQSASVPIYAKG
jgi:hypothetical protein